MRTPGWLQIGPHAEEALENDTDWTAGCKRVR